MNNGTCVDQIDGFVCTCRAPYWGTHCENDDTVCDEENGCPHDGECDTVTNTCQCTTPYITNCQHCVEGCVPDNTTGECVDYDECTNNPHPCGEHSTLTCVNLKSKPCSFCCLDENGDIKFCGPDESILSMNQEIENSGDGATIMIISCVLGAAIAILVAVICGAVLYARHMFQLKERSRCSKPDDFSTKGFENSIINNPLFDNLHGNDASMMFDMPAGNDYGDHKSADK